MNSHAFEYANFISSRQIFSITVQLVSTTAQCEEILPEFLSDDVSVVGMDCEYLCGGQDWGEDADWRVAILQISHQNECLLIQLQRLKKLPQVLIDFLENESYAQQIPLAYYFQQHKK